VKILDAYKIAAQLHARDVDKAGRPIIVDPQHLALLPVEQAASLRKRYERALAMLATTPRGQLAVARCGESVQASLRSLVERQEVGP